MSVNLVLFQEIDTFQVQAINDLRNPTHLIDLKLPKWDLKSRNQNNLVRTDFKISYTIWRSKYSVYTPLYCMNGNNDGNKVWSELQFKV